MDDSEQQSIDWDWLEAETYKAGRNRLIDDIKSDTRTLGVMAVGTVISLGGAEAISRLDSDAEPFLMIYPAVGVMLFGAIAIGAAGGLVSEMKEMRFNRRWKH